MMVLTRVSASPDWSVYAFCEPLHCFALRCWDLKRPLHRSEEVLALHSQDLPQK